MAESNDPLPSVESLQKRIDAAKSTAEQNNPSDGSSGRVNNKTASLVSGLAAGGAVGGGIGYGIDRWLSTSPIGLILGFFLGFAAGLYNLMREMKKEDL